MGLISSESESESSESLVRAGVSSTSGTQLSAETLAGKGEM